MVFSKIKNKVDLLDKKIEDGSLDISYALINIGASIFIVFYSLFFIGINFQLNTDVSFIFNLIFKIIFTIIGALLIYANGYLLLKQYRKKKHFMRHISLIFHVGSILYFLLVVVYQTLLLLEIIS